MCEQNDVVGAMQVGAVNCNTSMTSSCVQLQISNVDDVKYKKEIYVLTVESFLALLASVDRDQHFVRHPKNNQRSTNIVNR